MAYATRAHIVAIYGGDFLEDITPRDDVDPDATVDAALDNASAEIDGYLSVRYTVPLNGELVTLRRPCIDIAAYILANSHARLTEDMKDRYKAATAFLRRVGEGKAGLGRDEPSAAIEGSETGSASGADFSARPRKFGRGRS